MMMECRVCGREFVPEKPWYSECDVCKLFVPLEYISQLDYENLLRRLMAEIALEQLTHWDDTAIGDKDNACSWGLCSKALVHKFRERWHLCPMDRMVRVKDDKPALGVTGCFYRCRVFSPVKAGIRPTKRQAQSLVRRFREFDQPIIQYYVYVDGKRIYMPIGTSRVQANAAAAGISLFTGKHVFAHSKLVAWDRGPSEAQELIEGHDGKWMPYGT